MQRKTLVDPYGRPCFGDRQSQPTAAAFLFQAESSADVAIPPGLVGKLEVECD